MPAAVATEVLCGSNGAAVPVTEIGLRVTTDAGRSCCGGADRLATKDSDLPATTEVRAQAASDAAASATAKN